MRRYSEEKRKEMLAAGIIEPRASPYSSSVVMAKKSDRRFRFCVDYRRLNAITEVTAQPIPRILDALRDLRDATIFSALDLRSGY